MQLERIRNSTNGVAQGAKVYIYIHSNLFVGSD